MQITRSKWFQPSFSVGLGLLFLVALWIGGDLRGGVLAATAITGVVLITVVIGAFLVEVARGHDGSPYAGLGAIAGIAYLVAVAVLRVRG